jgi:hypothetical protein
LGTLGTFGHLGQLQNAPQHMNLKKPEIGEKVWSRFNQPKQQTLWYYRSIADTLCEKLDNQLSKELRESLRC